MRLLVGATKPTLIAATALGLLTALTAFAAAGDTVADRVFGQGGSFTTNTANSGGINASSLNNPSGVAVDSAGRLYVTDYFNNRVLEYDSPLTSQTATRVFGQAGSFTANTSNNGGISASSLNNPIGVAVDHSGRLYVADTNNNRVLEYDNPLTSQTAARVFGQGGSFTTNTANNGGISASGLNIPFGMTLDNVGRLYVADTNNNRVLEYDNPLTSQTATRVFGQTGNFTTNTANNGGISASSLSGAGGVSADSAGHLYISDQNNNRVLEYDNPLTAQTATRVFGQGGSFATNSCNAGGISASSSCGPAFMVLDSVSRLYLVEFGNHRALEYDNPLNSQAATRVFGQGGSFTTNTSNKGGIGASSLFGPSGAAVDNAGNLYVTDNLNNRVLEYDTPLPPPSVGGIAEQPDATTLPSAASLSGRDYTAYILGAVGALVAATVGAAGWRKRRS